MPNSPLDVAGIGGSMITGTITNSLNNYAQYQQNKQARKWAEKMYGQQRQDALADWQMQAAYNSPEAQMKRLRDAGLNPNLVYGHGADATMSAGVRSSSPGNYSPQQREQSLGVGDVVGQFLDTKIRGIQSNNLAIQAELMKQDLENKKAMEFKIYADTTKSQLQGVGQDIKNKYAPQLAEMSMEATRASVNKTLQSMDIDRAKLGLAIDANERANLLAGMTVKQAVEKIALMRIQGKNIEADTKNKGQQYTNMVRDYVIKGERYSWDASNQDAIHDRLNALARSDKKKAEILESTPDWGDQRALDMLEDILTQVTRGSFSRMYPTRTEHSYEGYTPNGKFGGESYTKRY